MNNKYIISGLTAVVVLLVGYVFFNKQQCCRHGGGHGYGAWHKNPQKKVEKMLNYVKHELNLNAEQSKVLEGIAKEYTKNMKGRHELRKR